MPGVSARAEMLDELELPAVVHGALLELVRSSDTTILVVFPIWSLLLRAPAIVSMADGEIAVARANDITWSLQKILDDEEEVTGEGSRVTILDDDEEVTSEGPTTPDPPKKFSHACFLLPVSPDGCVVLTGLTVTNLVSYLLYNLVLRSPK